MSVPFSAPTDSDGFAFDALSSTADRLQKMSGDTFAAVAAAERAREEAGHRMFSVEDDAHVAQIDALMDRAVDFQIRIQRQRDRPA